MQTKNEAQKIIANLVNRFSEQKDFYKKSDYNETLTRRDFIDPFFEALGWDVANKQGYAESYREVIHEDKIKVRENGGEKTKAPDYAFRLGGGKRLFFVEAKKPSVYVKDDILPAYQVRRYGWSAKMPISVITDFEEFAIYDCSKKPSPSDKASIARIKYLTYDNYLNEFDFIWNTFSKERVLKGSFDSFVKSDTHKKGTATVDSEFLQSLDRWRTYLAANISINNKHLNEDELNFVVQQTIDRIIFLRIAEDRGLEHEKYIEGVITYGKNYYQDLYDRFVSADAKYNSGLFNFKKDKISSKVIIDNKVIKSIVEELYYPKCEYEFSVMPVEILGTAYEQFLGKTITIDKNHKAKIEEKPEVRKAGGVYYTPQYIVDYIVKNTVGKLAPLNPPKGGKPVLPSDVSKIKICDPACGSGSFLLGAYSYLLQWHLDYYTQNPAAAKKDKALTPTGALVTALKKQILLNNIFGVDIDVNAVEVTKLSLLLKCTEGETEASIKSQLQLDRILPTLDDNIKSGNSLIDLDYYDNELDFGDEKKIKPFSWQKAFPEVFKQGGFDCVIGNPPYVKEYTSRETFEQIRKSHLAKYYQGKMDLWYFFACYGIDILKPNGLLGFIVPNNWVTNAGASILRNKVLTDSTIQNIVDFGAFMVFENASIQTMVLIVENKKSNQYEFDYRKLEFAKPSINEAFDLLNKSADNGNKLLTPTIKKEKLIDKFLVFGDNETESLLNKIQAKQNFILDARKEVAQGIVAPQDFLNNTSEKELNYTILKGTGIFNLTDNERKLLKLTKQENTLIKPFYNTDELSRYYGNNKNKLWVIYTNSEFKNPDKIKPFPNIKKHLDKFKAVITSDNKPYGLHRSRNEYFFKDEKIISLRKCAKPTFTYTNFDCYVSQTFFVIKSTRINQKYLTAFLNSNVVAFWLRNKGKMQGNLYQVDKEPILGIPIFDTPNNAAKEQIIKLVEQVLKLNKEKHETKLESKIEQLQNRIDYCEQKINEVVYELYELTKEEIAVIENSK
ncbi:MAG: N-6 DNA methylase [Bacteroidetes bacterium]|nr:N-6 DNA methylase [Bacteroidota bacterium]